MPKFRSRRRQSALTRPSQEKEMRRLMSATTEIGAPSATRSNKFVDQVFEEFLAATGIRIGFAFVQHVFLEVGETDFAFFDLRPNARIPRGVALLHEIREAAVLANGGGDFQAARKGVHA